MAEFRIHQDGILLFSLYSPMVKVFTYLKLSVFLYLFHYSKQKCLTLLNLKWNTALQCSCEGLEIAEA